MQGRVSRLLFHQVHIHTTLQQIPDLFNVTTCSRKMQKRLVYFTWLGTRYMTAIIPNEILDTCGKRRNKSVLNWRSNISSVLLVIFPVVQFWSKCNYLWYHNIDIESVGSSLVTDHCQIHNIKFKEIKTNLPGEFARGCAIRRFRAVFPDKSFVFRFTPLDNKTLAASKPMRLQMVDFFR